MPARVQARDAEIMRRELNCNMVRCAHYPQAEAFYDACDELGLLAWEEAPGWGYLGDDAWKALAYRDIGEMIARDRNHPSIIIWGAPIPRPFSRGSDGARAGARHRRLRRPVLRAARLDRIRLPVRQRQPVPGREVHRRGR